ncbi:hypothetical protein KI387_018299, partial [Taxus chinensis]
MSTAFEVGGRPIISFNGDWDNNNNSNNNNNNNNNNISATSTVVLDPAAFLANWKKQIQGKHNIPVNRQRLTFASNHCPYPGINLFSWSCAIKDQSANGPVAGDFVSCLQSWQAILRSEKRNIARLLDPEVLIESDKLPSDLKSKTAEEIRDLGIPCSVYYLSFDKCVLALQSRNCRGEAQSCKVSNLCIKVDKDLQLKEFEVDLYGHLSKSSHPLHFQYRFNGRHLVAHLSMLEQTAQYRQGQKMRHSLRKGNNTVDKLVDGSSTESLVNTDRTSALVKQIPSRDYYLPGSKEQELTARISPNYELKCIIVTVITLDEPWERVQTLMRNGFNERRPITQDSPRMHKNSKKETGRTQQWNSQCLVKSSTMNHLSEVKTPECTKKKGMLSAKSRKFKGSCNLESQPSKPEKEDSSNFQTNRVNGCSSTKQSADSSKSDDTPKKSSKKKKKKKGKHNPKNSGSDSTVPILKESSEDSSIASGISVTSISGSGRIPDCGNGDTNILKNNIKTKGETTVGHFSCANDLLSQTFTYRPQETSAEVFVASTQSATLNTLTEGPICRIYENGKKMINHTILSTEAIDIPEMIDERATSLDCSNEIKGCFGLQPGACGMISKSPIGDSKCGTVPKGRRVSDFHSIGNGTCLTRTNFDVMFAKSTFKADGSSNGHFRGDSGGVHNSETGNTNDIISVDSHDKNKPITKVLRSKEAQPDDKKTAGGKKATGNNCELPNSSSGSINCCGTTPKGESTDCHFSCVNGLSSQTSAFQLRGSRTEVFTVSTQNVTSNTLMEGPIHQIFEDSKKVINHTIESGEAIYIPGTIDEKSSLDRSIKVKGCIGFQTGSSSMNSTGLASDPSDKCGIVTKGRRVSDFHSIGDGTCSTSTDIDVMFAKSPLNAGSSSNGHLRGGGGVYNIETGNTSDIISVDGHDRNKHITKVGRSREAQPDDKKVAGGKKVTGNNCGLVSSSSGSINNCGIGNVHSRAGKENNHSVWQKVQKNTANDHIHVSGAGNYIQLSSTLDSQKAFPLVNLNSKENTTQISQKSSQEYGGYEPNNKNQKLSNSKIYLEHCDFWNCIGSHDVQCGVRVQKDSHRSQQGRDDCSIRSGNRKTRGITHTDVTKIGRDFEEEKTGCCRSETAIQPCQKGNLDFSCQTNLPRRFPSCGNYISHQTAEMHDTTKWKSSSAPSTPCQHGGDVLQLNRDDFSVASSSSPLQGQVNQMLPFSIVSNSADQEMLPTKNQGIQMTSAVHISEAQLVDEVSFHSPFQKENKTTESRIMLSCENDIDQHFNMQHARELDVPFEIKRVAMVTASTPDTGAAATQYMDGENNVHKGSSENYKLHASSDILLKSTVSAQETDTSNHVEQTNAVEKQHISEVSCKCLSYISAPASSSNAELKEMAHVISNSISASYESQLASESITHALGSPLAEFEKVIYSVSPEIEPLPHADKCCPHPRKLGITNLACRCQIADIPLKNIWHWFEEPGNYGLEVKAEDFRHTGRFSIDGLFRAYFVPYLSGIQLFQFSAPSQSCLKGAISTARKQNNEENNKVEDSYLSHFANLPILSTLLPKPYATEETTAPVCLYPADTSNITSDAGNHSCSTLLEYSGYGEIEVLFEYFESEQPQQRRPMLEKIRELIKTGAGSSSQVFGDPHILESMKIRDLHPASWFSVAWYPIYRIPEGQLRAAFLTYHSLGHFVQRDTSPSTLGGDIGSCIVAPVVGLQSYSAQ